MGVAEALVTTSVGIVVAVVATVFFNIFVRRIRTRTVEMEDAREELLCLLAQARRRRGPRRPRCAPPGGPGVGARRRS